MNKEQEQLIEIAWQHVVRVLRRYHYGTANGLFRPAANLDLSNLYYPKLEHINGDILVKAEKDYDRLIKDLDKMLPANDQLPIKRVIKEKIRKRLLMTKLIHTAGLMQNSIKSGNKVSPKVVKEFAEANDELYGLPNIQQVTALSADFYKFINDYHPDRLNRGRQAALSYLQGYMSKEAPAKLPKVAKSTQFDQLISVSIKDWAEKRFPTEIEIIRSLDDKQQYNAKDIKKIFVKIIDSPDWGVSIIDHALSVSVLPTSQKVHIPGNFLRNGYECKLLLAHEFIGHIKRSQNAKNSALPLFRSGMPDYGQFEEPFATLIGWVVGAGRKTIKPHGRDLYLAIALAKGLITRQVLDATQVYEILWRYLLLRDGDRPGQSIEKSRRRARTLTHRIFRGTPGNVAGLVLTKDIAYFEHFHAVKNEIVHQYSKDNLHNWLDFVMLGKFNAIDNNHVQLMRLISEGKT